MLYIGTDGATSIPENYLKMEEDVYRDLVPCAIHHGATLRSQMAQLQNVKKDTTFNAKSEGPLFHCPPSPLNFDTIRNKSCTPWFNDMIKTGRKPKKPTPVDTATTTSSTLRKLAPQTTTKATSTSTKPSPTTATTLKTTIKTEPEGEYVIYIYLLFVCFLVAFCVLALSSFYFYCTDS